VPPQEVQQLQLLLEVVAVSRQQEQHLGVQPAQLLLVPVHSLRRLGKRRKEEAVGEPEEQPTPRDLPAWLLGVAGTRPELSPPRPPRAPPLWSLSPPLLLAQHAAAAQHRLEELLPPVKM